LNLPDFPLLERDALVRIAWRFGVSPDRISSLPQVGICNAIFALGDDLILRVPSAHEAHTSAIRREAVTVPLAREVSVKTPALVAFDDSLATLPVPFGIWERVKGDTLGLLDLEPDETPQVWRAVGADLGRLHTRFLPRHELTPLEPPPMPTIEVLAGQLEREGWIGLGEARWLTRWAEQLEVRGGAVQRRFLHGDLQATNIMVSPTREYLALLDWGACGWGDAAWDFVGLPLRAIPFLLEGYREINKTPDAGLEARILRRHIEIGLFLMTRGAQPGKSWAERPFGMILEVMRFLQSAPEPWHGLQSHLLEALNLEVTP
jgi:Phosphotransferase enzyme family